jgi:hypothetical protein
MLYSKRRKNLGRLRKRSNRKFNISNRLRMKILKGGAPEVSLPEPNSTITVTFRGDWDALTEEKQKDIKRLFQSSTPTSWYISPSYDKFQLTGPKNSNVTEFDTPPLTN